MTNTQKLRSEVIPPVPWESLDKYVHNIFSPIHNGECVTTVWTRMAGRRMRNKFILENISLFAEQIGDIEKYLIAYIEPLDLTEVSPQGYLKLIISSLQAEIAKNESLASLKQIDLEQTHDYAKLLDSLKSLTRDLVKAGMEVVLFLGEFDELEFADSTFYNNLKSIWYSLQPHLHYVFLVMSNIENEAMYVKYRDLIEVLRQNIVYISLLNPEEATYVLDNFYKKYGLKDGAKYTPMLLRLCGGHPNLLKISTRNVADAVSQGIKSEDLEKRLLSHYEALSVCRTIYNSLGSMSKTTLLSVLEGKGPVDENSLAFKLELVRRNSKGETELFAGIFKRALELELDREKTHAQTKYNGKLSFEESTGNILIGGEVVDSLFTRQEYELLENFLKEPNKLRTRDDIGAILWGDHAYEKYSDWAIDQIISKLRKKLIKLNLGENIITTLRGRGYKISL